jgi:nicotinamidase-related amidase
MADRESQAHVCVSTTARDAARLGYDVIVAKDCVGDRDIPGVAGDDLTKIVMHELGDAFATIVQSSDIK